MCFRLRSFSIYVLFVLGRHTEPAFGNDQWSIICTGALFGLFSRLYGFRGALLNTCFFWFYHRHVSKRNGVLVSSKGIRRSAYYTWA